MNADHQEQTNGAKAIPASPLSLLVCDCPLTRLLSTALFAPFTRFLADPLGAEESQTCLIRHQRRRSLSAFIRVHPRLNAFHNCTGLPRSFRESAAASSRRTTFRPAMPSLKGVWLFRTHSEKYLASSFKASV